VEYLHQTPSTSCLEAPSWLFMDESRQASCLVEIGHDCSTHTVPGRCNNSQLDRSLFLAYPLQSLHVNFPLYLKIVLMKIYHWLDTFWNICSVWAQLITKMWAALFFGVQ